MSRMFEDFLSNQWNIYGLQVLCGSLMVMMKIKTIKVLDRVRMFTPMQLNVLINQVKNLTIIIGVS